VIGPLELIILILILLVIFGGYFRKRLPEFGRRAGEGAKVGTEKARELVDSTSGKVGEVGGKVGERVDPASIGRKAGEGMREARELRDSFKGAWDAPAQRPVERTEAPKPDPEAPASPPEPADEPADRKT
jgi:Sec-independent protein translocase protein TatA